MIQPAYEAWLRERAVQALGDGATTLRSVVERCDGADPVSVRAALATGTRKALSLPSYRFEPPCQPDGPIEPSLPPPHPLDYEWRFSRNGAGALLTKARILGAVDLAFIGATTVAISAARGGGWGSLVAIDRSSVVSKATEALQLPIRLVIADVLTHSPETARADAVIIDPPWYVECSRAFLLAAAHECRPGGHVLASFPGSGTRPGMDAEREHLVEWAKLVGLKLVSIEPQRVCYETPLFERNAFRAAGLHGDLRCWRRGDLWIFWRTSETGSVARSQPEHDGQWQEHALRSMRIRARTMKPGTGDTRLHTIVAGDVLPSVSRRDTRRDAVDLWTSGNRVFGCADSGTLLAALRAGSQGDSRVVAAEVALGRKIVGHECRWLLDSCSRIDDLSIVEQNEHAELSKEYRGNTNAIA